MSHLVAHNALVQFFAINQSAIKSSSRSREMRQIRRFVNRKSEFTEMGPKPVRFPAISWPSPPPSLPCAFYHFSKLIFPLKFAQFPIMDVVLAGQLRRKTNQSLLCFFCCHCCCRCCPFSPSRVHGNPKQGEKKISSTSSQPAGLDMDLCE